MSYRAATDGSGRRERVSPDPLSTHLASRDTILAVDCYMPFRLRKWYVDCVSDDGDVFIGYSAELRWRSLGIAYESALVSIDGEHVRTWTSLRNPAPPVAAFGRLDWNTPALGVVGNWTGAANPLRETIFSTEEGEIEWSCLLPSAEARVTTPAGDNLFGRGYAELLQISIPPWRMPVRELRWGRWLSGTGAVVWIDWQGDVSKRIVYRNGVRVDAPHVGNEALELADGTRLCLDQGCVLRSGTLGSTVLRRIPGLARAAPARMLAVEEYKWRSRGTLSSPGAAESRGWAIHEVVRWP